MIRRGVLAALAVLALFPLAAGDVASFTNLGFSPDSSRFMFGQYGIEQATGSPWAEVAIVDTKRNDFVGGSHVAKTFPTKIEAGQSPEGALFALLDETRAKSLASKIDHLQNGRMIYALVDGAEAPQTLEFRDFANDDAWQISMLKSVKEDKGRVGSSFGLSIQKVAKDGTVQRLTAGNPSILRDGVKDYLIRNVLVGPDGKTVVLVIEKIMDLKGDSSIRYMVETLRLP